MYNACGDLPVEVFPLRIFLTRVSFLRVLHVGVLPIRVLRAVASTRRESSFYCIKGGCGAFVEKKQGDSFDSSGGSGGLVAGRGGAESGCSGAGGADHDDEIRDGGGHTCMLCRVRPQRMIRGVS